MSVENCLRLADAIGERPSVILKLAKKPEMAVLSERLYGGRMTLSPREKELVRVWRELDEDARNAHETLMQITKQTKRATTAHSSGSGSGAKKSVRSRVGSTLKSMAAMAGMLII